MKYDVIVINTLYELGIHKRYRGVQYILSCMDYIENNKQNFLPITKILYVDVAKLHNTSKYNVENGIREIIRRIWNQTDNIALIEKIFGLSYNDKRPANTEFLIVLHNYLTSYIGRELSDGDDEYAFICPKYNAKCPFYKEIVMGMIGTRCC